MSYLETITQVFRRINLIDLIDLPFNIIHELYRSAFLTAQAQAEKEAEEKKKKEEEAREREREERRINRGGRSAAQVRSIPVKQEKKEDPSPHTPEERRARTRADSLISSGVEEIFEEGGF